MDRDSAQMSGDITDALGRGIAVRLGGALVRFSSVPVFFRSGQVCPPRPGVGFTRPGMSPVDVGRVDPISRRYPGAEFMEFGRPFRGGHPRVVAKRTSVIDRHATSIEARRRRPAGTKVTKPAAEVPCLGGGADRG